MKRFIYMILGVIVSMMLFSCDDSDSRYLLGKATGVDSKTNLPKYKPYKPDKFFRQLQNGEKSVTYEYHNSIQFEKEDGDDKWNYVDGYFTRSEEYYSFTIHDGKVWSVIDYHGYSAIIIKILWNHYCDISGSKRPFLVCNELSYDSATGYCIIDGYEQVLHYLDNQCCELETTDRMMDYEDNISYLRTYTSYNAVELKIYNPEDYIVVSSHNEATIYQVKKIKEYKEEILKRYGTTPEELEMLESDFKYIDWLEQVLSS